MFIVVFASVFSNIGDRKVTIDYKDEDGSAASRQLLNRIGDIPGFELNNHTDTATDELIRNIKNGKMTSLLVIPQGFGESIASGSGQAELFLYRDVTADAAVAPVQSALENIANGYRDSKLKETLAEMGKNDAEIKQILTPPVRVDMKESAAKLDMLTQVVPGYTVMFVFFVIITMVNRFLKDKESGMIARLHSTALTPFRYLIGMWIPSILIVIIQCIVLLAFGRLVYNMNLGDLAAVSLLIVSLALCCTGIGLALAMLAPSENMGVAFTQIIALGGAILGGLWFPFEMLPPFARAIGKFTPQYWALHGLQDVMMRGAHIGDVALTAVVLLAFAAAGLVVAVARFKGFIRSAVN